VVGRFVFGAPLAYADFSCRSGRETHLQQSVDRSKRTTTSPLGERFWFGCHPCAATTRYCGSLTDLHNLKQEDLSRQRGLLQICEVFSVDRRGHAKGAILCLPPRFDEVTRGHATPIR